MKDFDRISIDPAVMNGQPCIKGTRLTVKRVLLILASYESKQDMREDYPQLQDADIIQALEYAASSIDDEVVELHWVP